MEDNPICQSVFQNGAAEPERDSLTQAWAALINAAERGNAHLSGTASPERLVWRI